MVRLMDKLNVSCRNCNERHVPRRLTARYHDKIIRKRVHLWECKFCKHIWKDSAFNK